MVMRRYLICSSSLSSLSSGAARRSGARRSQKRAAAATAAVPRTCEAFTGCGQSGSSGCSSDYFSVSIQPDALPHGGKMKPFKYKPLGGVFIIRGPFHACRASPTVCALSSSVVQLNVSRLGANHQQHSC
ncbi:hypothetical protein GHT06_013025 [Daphnia sinensis]|uniref:Uncharacterized protein n=1 Tax=Daphnia sinensis TaxID=1820382 RepID=A0AAD5LG22_9CRUS|nr:hypothetical protein GHT06_013025 [Daphnia sinensis]